MNDNDWEWKRNNGEQPVGDDCRVDVIISGNSNEYSNIPAALACWDKGGLITHVDRWRLASGDEMKFKALKDKGITPVEDQDLAVDTVSSLENSNTDISEGLDLPETQETAENWGYHDKPAIEMSAHRAAQEAEDERLRAYAEQMSAIEPNQIFIKKHGGRDFEEVFGDNEVDPRLTSLHQDESESEEPLTVEQMIALAESEAAEDLIRRNKQSRYQDDKGEDWIDEFARTSSTEEFRGAMRFTIGKYNRRMGKKDDAVKEIGKMQDYCNRWLQIERGR